jgi:hypothetical protein
MPIDHAVRETAEAMVGEKKKVMGLCSHDNCDSNVQISSAYCSNSDRIDYQEKRREGSASTLSSLTSNDLRVKTLRCLNYCGRLACGSWNWSEYSDRVKQDSYILV